MTTKPRTMRKKKPRYSPVLAGLLAALLLAAGASAAEKRKSKVVPQAIVAGTVFQESGFLLRGARVVVTSAEKPKDKPNDKKEAITDMQGEFAVRVPAGKARYTVAVNAPGFVGDTKTVEITGDERLDLTFRLAPGPK